MIIKVNLRFDYFADKSIIKRIYEFIFLIIKNMKILEFMFILKFFYEKENLFNLIFEAAIYNFFFI